MNQKQYSITINGVTESISQIDALLGKLNEIENRLKNINTSSLSSSSSKGTSTATASEAKQQQEVAQATRTTAEENQRNLEALVGINRQLAENTNLQKEAMQIADRILGSNSKLHELNEQYKRDLEQIKSDRKEIDALERFNQISSQEALERRTALAQKEMEIKTARQQNLVVLRNEQKLLSSEEGSYEQISYALSRLKEALKSVNADNLSPEDFKKLSGAIEEMDKKAKDMAASMGEFQRNVGNYKSAFDGIEKLKIKIGDTEVEFNNLREANKKLENALASLAAQGKEGTEEWNRYEEALSKVKMTQEKVKDAADRAKDASKGLHDTLEMFEGITSIATIGRGFTNLFGVDNKAITESINKMTSLMGILQGISRLRTQMETGTGIGPMLKKMFDFTGNSPIQMLKNFSAQLKSIPTEAAAAGEGLTGLSKGATVASTAMSGLWKAIAGGAIMGVGMALFDKITDGISSLVGKFHDLTSWEDDAKRAADSYTMAVENENRMLQTNIDLIEQKGKLEGKSDLLISQEKIEETKKNLESVIDIFENLYDSQMKLLREDLDKKLIDGKSVSQELYRISEGMKSLNDVVASDDALIAIDREISKLRELESNGQDVRAAMEEAVGKYVQLYTKRMQDVDWSNNQSIMKFVELRQKLKDLEYGLASGGKASEFLKPITDRLSEITTSAMNAASAILGLKNAGRDAARALDRELRDLEIRAIADPLERSLKQLEAQYQRDVQDKAGELGTLEWNEYVKKRRDAYEQERKDIIDAANKTKSAASSASKSRIGEAEKTLKELDRIEQQIAQDKLNIMQGALTRELALINKEREERINALEKFKNDPKYASLIAELNTIFDMKETNAYASYLKSYFDEERKWADKVKGLYDEVQKGWMQFYNDTVSNLNVGSEFDLGNEFIEETLKDMNSYYDELGNILQRAKSFSEVMDEIRKSDKGGAFVELKSDPNKYFGAADAKRITELYDILSKTDVTADRPKKMLSVWQKYYADLYKLRLNSIEDSEAEEKAYLDQQLNETRDSLKQRLQADLDYLDERYNAIAGDQEALKLLYGEAENAEELLSQDMGKQRLEIQDKYAKLEEIALLEHQAKIEQVENKSRRERMKKLDEFWSEIINKYSDYYGKLQNSIAKMDSRHTDSFGIVDPIGLKKEKKQYLRELQDLGGAIMMEIAKLRSAAKEMDPIDYMEQDEALHKLLGDINEEIEELNKKDTIGAFISSINPYIQELGNAMSSIFSSIYDYQSYLLDQEEDALDKENDMLEKKLSEQEEITRKHKEAMDDIEDELKTARGDRRDALIDQLNAEVAAQRASLAAEQRIKAQQEALKKKEDALDLKRKKQQQQQSKTQAIISSALAVANALATQPFVPVGIAMGALAAAMGAVQVAMIAKQKFAEGGSVEGPSHSRGGVQAELEGGEYVINKKAFSKNAELVELINSAGRRLTLGDIANAGYDFPNSIESNSNSPIVVSSQEPIWVSVTDINNVQRRMAVVKEMAD